MKLISLKKDPNIQINKEIEYFLNPDFLYIPGSNIKVTQNEVVYKDMLVTKNYTSPVSGIAYGTKKCLFGDGWQKALVIENDFRELKKQNKRDHKTTIKNILDCLEENHDYELLEKFRSQNKFTNIIITAINDDVYIYNNIFILKENIAELLELFDELSLIYKSDFNYLVVKNVDTMLINECLNTIGTYPNIALTLVNDEYLLGRLEFLASKLQIKGNTLYLTTTELLKLYNYLHERDNTTLLLTVAGNALAESKMIRVKKYTLLKDILDKYFAVINNDYQVIINGLMQGYLVTDLNNFVVDDNVFAVNIMSDLPDQEPKCINCGKCIRICPRNVNPLTKKNIENCIHCGLCSYVCPGFVNLRAHLRGEDDV